MVYNRWGRVGMKGQDKIFGPYNLQDTAINEFEQKFFAKTKNHWSNRQQFTSYPKCYTWLEMDYSANQKEESVVSSFITKILTFFILLFFVKQNSQNVILLWNYLLENGYVPPSREKNRQQIIIIIWRQ